MSSSLLPLLDQALTELEALEKRLEAGHISDARHWPSLSLSIRKLASTSVELVNMTETRNRTNRAQMISFCARMKTIALIFHETIATREIRNVPVFPTPGSGKIARIGKTPSSGRVAQASIAASRDTEALLMPDLSTPFQTFRFLDSHPPQTTLHLLSFDCKRLSSSLFSSKFAQSSPLESRKLTFSVFGPFAYRFSPVSLLSLPLSLCSPQNLFSSFRAPDIEIG